MKQRESSSPVKSWIFVWLVSSAAVWLSQQRTFPLNRDTGMVESCLKEGFFVLFSLFRFPCFSFGLLLLSVGVETELTMPVSNHNYSLYRVYKVFDFMLNEVVLCRGSL